MKKLNANIKPLINEISSLFPCAKNSKYKSQDFACRLIDSALENQSFEAMHKLTKTFSADRVLSKLHEVEKSEIEDLMKFSSRLKLPKSVDLAIDFHDKIFYGDKNHFEIMGSKGGKYVKKYIEASLVYPKFFVSAYPVNQFTNNKVALISKIVDGFYENYDSKIGLVLADREFATKDVVNYFCQNNLDFVMPISKNKTVKRFIEDFEEGKSSKKIDYRFGKQILKLLFLRVEGEVYSFITNTRLSPVMAARAYKKRWQIETNFREQNNFLFKTKTLNFLIRYIAFVLSGLILNLWQEGRILIEVESYLFKRDLKEEILNEFSGIVIFRGCG